jgi:hypothetical protein
MVLERIDIALGSFLDEIAVQDLPAVLFVLDPLGSNLDSMAQPVCGLLARESHSNAASKETATG